MDVYQLRNLVTEHGVPGVIKIVSDLLEGRKLPNGASYKLEPRQFSLKTLWEGLVGSIASTLDNPLWREAAPGALDPTGFPSITEKLISNVTIAAYTNRGGLADQLVPNSTEPRTLTERITGFTMPEGPMNVLPAQPYPAIGFGEKYVTFQQAIDNKKEGMLIAVTEEAVRFDQTGSLLRQAETIGDTLQTERERRTVRAIMGIGLDRGTVQDNVYFPSDVDTPMYRAATSNLRTNASPIFTSVGQTASSVLVDWTDFQEVLTVHAQNITDDRQVGTGRPIVWSPDAVLVPVALLATAANIINSTNVTMISFGGNTAAQTPEIRANDTNPMRAMFMGALPMPMASPYVDEVSSTMWIVYDRRRAFIRVNIFPFATFRAPTNWGWDRDIVTAVRVREWSRCIALDYRQAIRNNGA